MKLFFLLQAQVFIAHIIRSSNVIEQTEAIIPLLHLCMLFRDANTLSRQLLHHVDSAGTALQSLQLSCSIGIYTHKRRVTFLCAAEPMFHVVPTGARDLMRRSISGTSII